jgi:amidase
VAGVHVEADYTRFLDPEGLKGARIGVARNLFGANLAADRVVDRDLQLMAAAGAVLVDPAEIETAGAVWTFDSEVLMFELKAVLDQFLGGLDKAMPVHSLRDLIAFNERNRDRELKWFGQELFEYAATKGPLTSPEYQRALLMVRQLAREQGIDATLDKHRLDAIVAPTQAPAGLIDPTLGDSAPLGSFVTPAAAGYPCLTVPAGDVGGLPVGMLFMGPAWSEGKLIRLAFAFEQLVQARRAPAYVTSEPRPAREEVD